MNKLAEKSDIFISVLLSSFSIYISKKELGLKYPVINFVPSKLYILFNIDFLFLQKFIGLVKMDKSFLSIELALHS